MTDRKKAMARLGLCGALLTIALGVGPQSPSGGGVNNAKLATTLVNECAGIRGDELVIIEGGSRDAELLENLAIAVRKTGAHPLITYGSDRLTRQMYSEVPAKFDNQEPAFEKKLADIVDAIISIDYSEQPDLLADVDPHRIMARSKVMEAVDKTMRQRGVVMLSLGNDLYPTKARAERFGIAQGELAKIFWDGVNVDYKQLQATGATVQAQLAAGKTAHITAPNGTDLTVQIAQRPVFVSDGVVSSEDRTTGGPATQVWLPAGEVYVTAVTGSAKGTFIADHFEFQGQHIEGLTLKFEAGKVTSITAKSDISKLKAFYDAAPAGKELFGIIDIGINPSVRLPATAKLATWMAAGTISVTIGSNAWAGGDNTTPFDLAAHLTGGTLSVDDKKIIDQGKLIEK